jgi:hypothetical protein
VFCGAGDGEYFTFDSMRWKREGEDGDDAIEMALPWTAG